VGQGNCTVLEFPDGRVGVADCGSTSVSNVGRYRLIQYLAYLGYGNHINEVWLSHFDEDHVNGFLDVLDRGMIIDHLNISAEVADESLEGMDSSSAPLSESSSKSSADSSSDHENFRSVEEIIRKVEERGGTVELWKAGDSMTFEPSACITCLWPLNTDGIGDNDNSQVLLYEYEGTRILLTGDITTAGAEEELIGLMKEALTPKEFFPVTVLQLPHHGSKYSSSEEFLSFFSPEQAVCSVGVNRYGHPTPEVIRRVGNVGVELYRTDQDGCVTVRMEGERVEVMTYSR